MSPPKLQFQDPAFGIVELREGRRNVVGRTDGGVIWRSE